MLLVGTKIVIKPEITEMLHISMLAGFDYGSQIGLYLLLPIVLCFLNNYYVLVSPSILIGEIKHLSINIQDHKRDRM